MFPCRFNISTRNLDELAARRAIKDIEGKSVQDVSEYINHKSRKYQKMVNWISRDLGVTSLRYQTVDDMVKAIGLSPEKLCLYCWTGKAHDKIKRGGKKRPVKKYVYCQMTGDAGDI